MVLKLPQVGARPGAVVDALDTKGQTALHCAVAGRQLACVGVLLRHGASAYAEDNDGVSPLRMAVDSHSVAMCKLLSDAPQHSGLPHSVQELAWSYVSGQQALASLRRRVSSAVAYGLLAWPSHAHMRRLLCAALWLHDRFPLTLFPIMCAVLSVMHITTVWPVIGTLAVTNAVFCTLWLTAAVAFVAALHDPGFFVDSQYRPCTPEANRLRQVYREVTVVRPWHISDASGAASGAGATAGSTASGEAAGRTSGDSGGPPTLLPHRSPSAQHLTTAKPLRSGPVMASHLCATCQLERPDRAKHCRVCDRCCSKFDHHCPWLANCVGLHNYRSYFVFVLCATLSALLWLVLYAAFVRRLSRESGASTLSVAREHWFVTLTTAQLLWMAPFGGLLVAQHVRLIARNLTTNEAINYSKYAYLRDPETGKFRNPFNKGWQWNVLMFLGFSVLPHKSKSRRRPSSRRNFDSSRDEMV